MIAGFLFGTPTAAVADIAISGALWILVMAGSAALQGILVAALYEFAAEGTAPEGFDQAMLQTAFGPKRSR